LAIAYVGVPEFRVCSAHGQKLIVGALFLDAALCEHDYPVSAGSSPNIPASGTKRTDLLLL
jgi:hypothetical protein